MEVWRSSIGATIVREIAMADGLAFNAALRTAKRLTSHSGRTIVVLAERFPPVTNVSLLNSLKLSRVMRSMRFLAMM